MGELGDSAWIPTGCDGSNGKFSTRTYRYPRSDGYGDDNHHTGRPTGILHACARPNARRDGGYFRGRRCSERTAGHLARCPTSHVREGLESARRNDEPPERIERSPQRSSHRCDAVVSAARRGTTKV